jgi:hypothetical protein
MAQATFQVENPQTKRTYFPPPLAAYQSYDQLAVVAIDVTNHTVRVSYAGAERTLDFIHDGVEPAPTKAPMAVPLIPNGLRAGGPESNQAGLGFTPTSVRRTSMVGGGEPLPLPTTGKVFSNDRTLIAGGNQPFDAKLPGIVSEMQAMTREQAEERIELEREMRRQRNDPTHILLPPTSRGESSAP